MSSSTSSGGQSSSCWMAFVVSRLGTRPAIGQKLAASDFHGFLEQRFIHRAEAGFGRWIVNESRRDHFGPRLGADEVHTGLRRLEAALIRSRGALTQRELLHRLHRRAERVSGHMKHLGLDDRVVRARARIGQKIDADAGIVAFELGGQDPSTVPAVRGRFRAGLVTKSGHNHSSVRSTAKPSGFSHRK
jgi:hypothetical protein